LYKISLKKLEAAKKYITKNLHKKFIVPSSAPYASPILMASKPGGGLRFCMDFQKLNAATQKNQYSLSLITKILDWINYTKIFTKLDIQQGFYYIRLSVESEDLTIFYL
jgi:hypothetical protein